MDMLVGWYLEGYELGHTSPMGKLVDYLDTVWHTDSKRCADKGSDFWNGERRIRPALLLENRLFDRRRFT